MDQLQPSTNSDKLSGPRKARGLSHSESLTTCLPVMAARRNLMKRWMLGLLVVLFSATLAAAQQQPPTPVTPQPGEIPQIVAFDNDSLLGDHIHIFGDTPDLGKWGNSISSMVILAGRWDFFDEEKFQGTKVELGPGVYLHVKDHGIKDNSNQWC